MPFASDKQRRYLWSQKPEVARQIAYKNTGGWWNASTEASPMQIRNRQYNEYIRAGSPGKFKDWLAAGGGANVDTTQPSFQKSARDVARIATPYGSVEDAMSAGKNIAAGNYGQAAADAGLAAAGLIPFVRPAARAIKAAPLAKAALQGGEEGMDYAKLFAREAAGLPDRPARSVGASAAFGTETPQGITSKFTKGSRKRDGGTTPASEYIERLGFPGNHPQSKKAAADIAYDIDQTLIGKRTDPDSKIWRDAQLTGGRMDPKYNVPQPNESIINWARPTQERWAELYGDLPYPSRDPILTAAKALRPSAEGAETTISSLTPGMKMLGRNNVSARQHMASNRSAPLGPKVEQPKIEIPVQKTVADFTPDEMAAASQMKAAGATNQEIADQFGISSSQVKKIKAAEAPPAAPTMEELSAKLDAGTITDEELAALEAMGFNRGGPIKRNPLAAMVKTIKPTIVKPRKGKGSYSRKGRGPLAGGY